MDGEEQSEAGKKSGREAGPVRVVVQSLGHPLMLLLIGSLLTYIVAPIIVDGINAKKLRQEAKQKKALEIWARNTEFNSKLNALKTMLESYHNQNVRFRLAPDDLAEAQKEFRREFTKRYLELDETAWWWYRDLQRELSNLDLAPKDQTKQLNDEFDKYGRNVASSVALLKPLWVTITSHEYRPDEDKTKTDFDNFVKQADAGLTPLFHERSDIIRNVTGIITDPR